MRILRLDTVELIQHGSPDLWSTVSKEATQASGACAFGHTEHVNISRGYLLKLKIAAETKVGVV